MGGRQFVGHFKNTDVAISFERAARKVIPLIHTGGIPSTSKTDGVNTYEFMYSHANKYYVGMLLIEDLKSDCVLEDFVGTTYKASEADINSMKGV